MKSWVCKISGIYDTILCLSVSNNGEYLAAGGEGKKLYLWNLSDLNGVILNRVEYNEEDSQIIDEGEKESRRRVS